MWLPRRFDNRLISARDWYVLIVELGERTVEALRQENPFGRFYR
jgi:hypothetical protein